MKRIPTASQTMGPFFNFGLTANSALGRLAGDGAMGQRIQLTVQIRDGAGAPAPGDAMIELWQADAQGKYAHPEDTKRATPDPNFSGFGRMETQPGGCCIFETVKPGATPGQAPHINVTLFARGLLKHLHTRIYFEGEPANAEDPVLALVPADRRWTLLARETGPGAWRFEIQLQGEGETVFFDV
jgi:protocatechuate 3,4-dioxygenase, alpha subunit